MSGSTRWLVIVGVVAGALVAASLLVSQLAGREADLAPDTPEGAVQAYLEAVADNDAAAVFEFYSEDLQARCQMTNVRESLRYGPGDFRAALGEVIDRGETTDVFVAVTQVYGDGPFGRDESTFDQVFVLQESEGTWRFVEPPWPTWCPTPVPEGRPSTAIPGRAPWWG